MYDNFSSRQNICAHRISIIWILQTIIVKNVYVTQCRKKKNRAIGSTKNVMFIVHSISWGSLSSHAIIIHQIARSNSCYSLVHIMTRCYEDSTFAVPTTSRPIFPLSLAATLPLAECTVSRERALTYSFGRCENPPRPRVLVQVAGNCFSEREHRAYRAIRAENRCWHHTAVSAADGRRNRGLRRTRAKRTE